MDVAYINPFITSTIDAFATMLNVKVLPGKPHVKSEPFPSHDVSGIIGLSGDAQGCVTISFPKIAALKVVSAILGVTLKVTGPELSDGIGELANIIAGGAKQYFDGMHLLISLPNVVIGKNHILVPYKRCPTLVVPFSSSLGDFTIEVALTKE